MPEVSVVIPVRRPSHYLDKALLSVADQNFQNLEVLIIFDGVGAWARSWQAKHQFDVKVLVNDEQRGAAASRNVALAAARGEYIAFLDDDDCWLPGYLTTQIEHLRVHPGLAACYTDHFVNDKKGRWHRADIKPVSIYPSPLIHLLSENFIHTMSALVCRRSVLGDVGMLDQELLIVHDWEWYIRLLGKGNGRIGNVNIPLVFRRQHEKQLVADLRLWINEENRVLDRFFKDNPQLRHLERLVRSSRDLYFGYSLITRGRFRPGLAHLKNAIRKAKGQTMKRASVRLFRNLELAVNGRREMYCEE